MEVAITDSELELLQKLRVVHQVESVEHVEVGLRNEYLELVVMSLYRFGLKIVIGETVTLG